MKARLLNLGLVLTSLLAYLEWGNDNKMFLVQGEWEVISKLFTDPASVIHPLTIIPLLGQIILIGTLFQNKPGRKLTLAGLSGIGTLMLMIFMTGLLSANFKILLSTVPFLLTAYGVVTNRAAYS